MGNTNVDATAVIRAPIGRVFEFLADHEGMATWPGVKASRVVTEGEPRNGLGAIRRITAGGITLDEKIVRWDPPHGYDYTIIKGLPVKHLGTVKLTETPAGVVVSWNVQLESRLPFVARIVGFALGQGLPKALKHVTTVLEREPLPTPITPR